MRNGKARGFVRRFVTLFGDEGTPQINNRGELCVVQALPPTAELVRLGRSFVATGGQLGLVVGLPTTSCNLLLLNREPPNGKAYIIESVSIIKVASAAIALNMSIAVQLNTTSPIAVPTQGIQIRIRSCSGLGSGSPTIDYGGNAIVKESAPANVVPVTNDNAWHHIATTLTGNTSNATLTAEKSVYGRYIVPPQGAFAMQGMISVTGGAGSNKLSVIWHEVQLPR